MKNSLFTNVLIGFLLGCCFPILATLIEIEHQDLSMGFRAVVQVHTHEPLLWIIDTAPLILSLMAWLAGYRAQQLKRAAQEELNLHHIDVLHTLDVLPVAVFAMGADGVPFYSNEKAIQLLGKGILPNSNIETLSSDYKAYVTGTDIPYPADQLPIVRALSGEQVQMCQIEIERDGSRVMLEVSATPIRDRMGKVLSAVAVFHDITERTRSEVQLHSSRSFLDSVVQTLPIMLFVKDAETLSFVRLNKFGEELLGVSEEDMLGKTDYDFFPKEQADFFVGKDRQVLLSGDVTSIDEEPITTIAKGKRILRTRKVAIHDDKGQPKYLLGISEDITELKQAEELNQKYTEDLQRAYRNLDQFAYVISHDLKAPMRGIRNLTDWIVEDLQGKVPESVERHINMLQDRTEKLERLISGVLEYSRSGRRKGAAEMVDTGLLVPEVAELAGIRQPFQVLSAASMPEIMTDKLLLAQVLTNLILNAVQHHDKEAGRVEVSGAPVDANWVEFAVKDDGPGIMEDMQGRIFQLFYTQDAKGQGSGIGLAIVKKIVEDQGGSIKVMSSASNGTEFRFTWPVQMRD